jgi:hypothetical protein
MPEFLTVTFAVIFCIFIIVGCASALAAVFMLKDLKNHTLRSQSETIKSFGEVNECLKKHAENDEKIINMSTFLLKLADANNDLREAIKEGFTAQTTNSEEVIEANVKISNQNAQVLMDVLVTLAQMQELVLKGMGYTPSNPMESGLKDLDEQRANYAAPPAPKKEEGLTFPKK